MLEWTPLDKVMDVRALRSLWTKSWMSALFALLDVRALPPRSSRALLALFPLFLFGALFSYPA